MKKKYNNNMKSSFPKNYKKNKSNNLNNTNKFLKVSKKEVVLRKPAGNKIIGFYFQKFENNESIWIATVDGKIIVETLRLYKTMYQIRRNEER